MRRSLLVFTEGQRTEVDYLTHWHRTHRQTVTVEIDPRHGRDPLSLVHLAIDARRDATRAAKSGQGAGVDEYWCVVDVDEHVTLGAAIELAAQEGVNLAVSNPCFELWLLLHYQDQRGWLDRHGAGHKFRSLSGVRSKDLPGDVLAHLAKSYPDARRRAQALATMHTGNGTPPPDDNPSSTAWMIVESIRAAGRTA